MRLILKVHNGERNITLFRGLLQICGVITDSGSITEETTVLRIPCKTLRDNTKRPETVTIGTNELAGTDPKNLPPHLQKLIQSEWKTGAIPDKGDG